jgi:glyoxylase-like metal-dependent hydrolase (beta-lactamase superfamily II)
MIPGMYEMILPGLHLIGSGNLTHTADCQAFLVETGPEKGSTEVAGANGGWAADDREIGGVIIDAGADPTATGIIQNIEVIGVKPTHLILTHGHIDHIGGASALKERFGLTVIAHENDADIMETYDPIRSAAGYYGLRYPPVGVDKRITCDMDLTLGERRFRLIEMPGHTPGSIAVFTKIGDKRILFGQDIHGPFNPVWGSDQDIHSISLGRLQKLRANILCEGHFGIIRSEDRVRDYIESYR